MPRTVSRASESPTKPKKAASRQRPARRSAAVKAATNATAPVPSRRPRRAAASTTPPERARKAPTQLPVAAKRPLPVVPVLAIAALLVMGGVSAMIGLSDPGQINVAAVISEQQVNAPGATASAETAGAVPVMAPLPAHSTPNGGLHGMGQSFTPPPVQTPVVATGTATSSPDNAASSTSTADTADEPPPATTTPLTATATEPAIVSE